MPSSLVLVPPLVVLSLSLVTKRIVEALFAGILVAACIASDFSPFAALNLTINKFWDQFGLPAFFSGSGSENVYLFGFLIFLGIFIALLTHTGGTQAYSQLINKTLRSRKNVETSSLVLSLLCMIDDYFSILTVGSVMRNLAQSFKIPHVKLAFLINSMGPPLCILCPITSWSAMLLGQLSHAGVSTVGHFTDPFFMYLRIIPYIFYSFIIFCSTWFIVRKRISYGPMHQHELIAKSTGNLFGGKDPVKNTLNLGEKQGTLVDFIFPIFFLMIAVMITILASGHYFGAQNIGIARALSQANIFYALCIGSLSALLLSALWYVMLGKCSLKELVSISRTGCTLMMQSIAVLILANIFSDFIKTDLATSSYVAHYLTAFMNMSYFPFAVFLISLIISATTGSSWGSIAIMVPLSVPMLISLAQLQQIAHLENLPLLLPTIGAILSGSIAGTHISPLADNMVMASLSTGTYHTDHVKTQIWYSMPSIIACAVSFLALGLLSEWHRGIALFISLFIGITVALSLLTLLHHYQEKKDKKD